MKQKLITFITGFIIYGLLFGVLMYTDHNLKVATEQGLFFGTFMGLFDTFILPKINVYFANRNKKQ
ncbi:MAG: hypothetical protein ACOYLT_06995 [Flavobacterium sp.]|uniref:hypothetical protein n=1 Tax=Flavobacterium sp. TaxID=239 RepID=UPI003BD40B20